MKQDLNFEFSVIKLASNHKSLLREGELAFKKEKTQIGIETFIGSHMLVNPEFRVDAWKSSKLYRKLLAVEADFYSLHFKNYISGLSDLAEQLDISERAIFLNRVLPTANAATELSLKINEIKVECVNYFEDILRFYDSANLSFDPDDTSVVFEDEIALQEFTNLEDRLMRASEEQLVLVNHQINNESRSESVVSRLFKLMLNSLNSK